MNPTKTEFDSFVADCNTWKRSCVQCS